VQFHDVPNLEKGKWFMRRVRLLGLLRFFDYLDAGAEAGLASFTSLTGSK